MSLNLARWGMNRILDFCKQKFGSSLFPNEPDPNLPDLVGIQLTGE